MMMIKTYSLARFKYSHTDSMPADGSCDHKKTPTGAFFIPEFKTKLPTKFSIRSI
jgi:hypothetical protein